MNVTGLGPTQPGSRVPHPFSSSLGEVDQDYGDAGTDESDRPSGRDEVREALVSAGLKLVATSGLQFSIRDVADLAQVNHGLVHRHFGSKAGLVEAILERFNRDALASLDPDGRPGNATWANLREIAVVLARIALEADSDPFNRHPVFGSWIESLRRDSTMSRDMDSLDLTEAKARVAAAAALALGWALFGQVIAFGVAANDSEKLAIENEVRRVFGELGGGSLSMAVELDEPDASH